MADFLNSEIGLPALWAKIKALIPTKTSDLTNDSDFITDDDVIVTVTKNLTNCLNGSSVSKALIGGEYTTTISPAKGYQITSVKVMMDGVDITDSVFTGVAVGDGYVTESRVIQLIDDNRFVVTHDGNGVVTITGINSMTNASTQEY